VTDDAALHRHLLRHSLTAKLKNLRELLVRGAA